MNPRNKTPLQAHGPKHSLGRRTVNSPLAKPGAVQPKMAMAPQVRKQPVAPPVYRHQSGSKSVQAKVVETANNRMRSVASHKPRVIQRMALTVGAVDSIIRRSMGLILVHKEHQPQPGPHDQLPSLENGNLAAINQNETLYLDAHGETDQVIGGIPGTALQFGGYTPEQLAAKLVEKGLPQNYAGRIYLNGCITANDLTGEAYTSRFQKALALRGRSVRVKGNTGNSQVKDSGKTRVNPPTQQGALERTRLDQIRQQSELIQSESQRLVGEILKDRSLAQTHGPIVFQNERELNRLEVEMKQQNRRTYLNSKALRPTLPVLQNLSYEITPGSYAVIPGDNHNGKSLSQHIRRALDKYDDQWNLLASDASKAAAPILRGLLNRPQKLFVAVRYYLAANQPRPPAEFVQLGAKLNVGSDLYKYLLAEFNGWLA